MWLNNLRLGKPGLRENASALTFEEWQNNQELGRPALKDDAVEDRLNNHAETRQTRLERYRAS